MNVAVSRRRRGVAARMTGLSRKLSPPPLLFGEDTRAHLGRGRCASEPRGRSALLIVLGSDSRHARKRIDSSAAEVSTHENCVGIGYSIGVIYAGPHHFLKWPILSPPHPTSRSVTESGFVFVVFFTYLKKVSPPLFKTVTPLGYSTLGAKRFVIRLNAGRWSYCS